jgi:hypothetical protein
MKVIMSKMSNFFFIAFHDFGLTLDSEFSNFTKTARIEAQNWFAEISYRTNYFALYFLPNSLFWG